MAAAIVNLTIFNNETFQYAFSFGTVGDLSWSFDHCDLYCDIKTDPAATPILSLSTVNGKIVISDSVGRIMNFLVADEEIRAALAPANYVYDLILVNQTTLNTQRLMGGKLTVTEGVTKEP